MSEPISFEKHPEPGPTPAGAVPPASGGPVPPPAGGRNGFGLAALIVGIVAVVLALIPFASYGAWLVGIAAVVLGIIGLVKAGARPKGTSITGLVLGGVAVILSIVMSVVYTVLFVVGAVSSQIGSITDLPSVSVPTLGASAETHTAQLTVTGDVQQIRYRTFDDAETVASPTSPWTKSVATTHSSEVVSIIVTGTGDSKVTCSITVDGDVLTERSGSGVVLCLGTVH